MGFFPGIELDDINGLGSFVVLARHVFTGPTIVYEAVLGHVVFKGVRVRYDAWLVYRILNTSSWW